METFLKEHLYFHRIDTYCFINHDIKYIFTHLHLHILIVLLYYDIKYIFTLKAVLLKALLMKLFYFRAKVRFQSIFIYTM